MRQTFLLLFLLTTAYISAQSPSFVKTFDKAERYLANKEYDKVLEVLEAVELQKAQLSNQEIIKYALLSAEAYKQTYELNNSLQVIKTGLQAYNTRAITVDSNYLRLLLSKGLLEDDLREPYQSIQTLESILDQSTILPKGHEILPLAYQGLGAASFSLGQYQEAIKNYNQSKSLFVEKYGNENHTDIASLYSNIGNCYKYLLLNKEAEENHKKAWAIANQLNDIDPYKRAGVSYNIAIFFIQIEDYGQALLYANHCLEIVQQELVDTPLHAYTLNILANIHCQLGDYEKAQNTVDLALPIYTQYQSDYVIQTYHYYTNRGYIYSVQGKTQQAVETFHYAASLLEPIKEQVPLELANCYGLLGPEYTNLGQFDKALRYLEKAVELSTPLLGDTAPEVIFYTTDIAHNYIEWGDLQKALVISNDAIEKIGFNAHSTSPYEKVSEVSTLLRSFNDKVIILFKLYQKTKDQQFLAQAKEQINLNLKTLNYLRYHYNNPLAIIGTNIKYQVLFEWSLTVCYEAYQNDPSDENIQLFLKTMEAFKSYALLDKISSASANNYSKIAASTIDEERQLKSKLAFWEAELPYMETDEEIQNATTQILHTKIAVDSITGEIKKQFATYSSFMYYTEAPKISDLQSTMQTNEAILEYTLGAEEIYVIKITKTEASLCLLKKDASLENWINTLNTSIKNPFIKTVSETEFEQYKKDYEKWALLLYQKLIEPLGALPSKLTIIPDDYLWQIPFDCLLTEENNTAFNQKPYLANQHIIDFQYTLTLLEVLEKNGLKKEGWVGFAPQFSQQTIASTRSDLGTLEYNVKEIESIAKLTGGIAYNGVNASKNQFLNSLDQYAVYHLATHAVAGQENRQAPYLAFSLGVDEWKLTVDDIYKLNLAAEMVVLSACNSGQGKIEKGEGIASLGRAFFYAGTKSAIMTQWQVNDQATATIMTLFYEALKKGVPKNMALNSAKKAYIERQKNQLYAHPFYWAGFTAVGNMEAVSFAGQYHYLWWVLGVMALLLLVNLSKNYLLGYKSPF